MSKEESKMNEEARKIIKGLCEFQPLKAFASKAISRIQNEEPVFSAVPLPMICQSILLLINELRNRGYPVYDFDHKEKSIQGIKVIRNKVYFLAAEEAETDGKAQAGSEENGKQTHG